MINNQEDLDVEELFSHVKDISSLAHFARCQAQEAEMRANYALNLAEKAAMEAEAVRHVAESLTKTARSVAKMSLEHINKINTAEYRSFKRGEILAAVRNSCERKIVPEQTQNHLPTSPRKRQKSTPKAIKREALSEESVVHTRLVSDNKSPSPESRPDPSQDPSPTTSKSAQRPDSPSSTLAPNLGSDVFYNSDLLVCVESLHRQSSHSGSQFTETFPDTEEVKSDIVKDFDSTEKLPIVWEDSYQGQAGRRPMPWSDKKSIRKMQRKLRDLEDTEEVKSSDCTEGEDTTHGSEEDCKGTDDLEEVSQEDLE